jgi:hypothetical protein
MQVSEGSDTLHRALIPGSEASVGRAPSPAAVDFDCAGVGTGVLAGPIAARSRSRDCGSLMILKLDVDLFRMSVLNF